MLGDIGGPRPLGNISNVAMTFLGLTLTGLSASQPVITNSTNQLVSGTINLASSSFVSGILPLANGGTNANLTASNGGIVWSNASQFQILSGTSTANQVLLSGNTSTPNWSTATYPATTTINQILFSSAANNISGITSANSGVLVSTSSGVPQFSSTMTNGQVIIGSTGGTPTAATLTQGSGVTISNAAGSITISGTGGTVTSISAGAGITLSPNPITTTGTISLTTTVYSDGFCYSRFGGV